MIAKNPKEFLTASERKNLRSILRKHARVSARYEGATYSTRRSRLPNGIQIARLDTDKATRVELARRADYWEKNDPITNRIADLWENYTVGWNLQIAPATSSPEFNAEVKSGFDDWCEQPEVTSRQDLVGVLGVGSRGWLVRGDHFIQLTKVNGKPAIQGIEGTQVETPSKLREQEGEQVIDGVGIDANGAPVNYFVGNYDKRGKVTDFDTIPVSQMVHIAEFSRAGQYRGVTPFHCVLNEIHDLFDLHFMEMMAARDAAERSLIILNQIGEADDETLVRRAGQVSTQTSGGTTITEDRASYYREVLGGRIAYGMEGETIHQLAGERPSVVTRDYWRYKTELACIGVGIPYVLVFPDSMQGTVFRGALDTAQAFFRARFKVIDFAARQIYRWFVQQSFAKRPADWKKVSVQPPRAVNVDVGRNSAALMNELEHGATNFDLIYGPLGLDWREELQKLADQLDFCQEVGLPIKTLFGLPVSKLNAAADAQMAADTATADEPMPAGRMNGEGVMSE